MRQRSTRAANAQPAHDGQSSGGPPSHWQGTNLPRVGGFNRAVVLDAIRAHGQISRVELARTTGLTPQTMSNIVNGLIDDGVVVESGHAPSTGGKRRVLLELVPDAVLAIGLHVEPERVTGVLLDLVGSVLLRSHRRLPDGATPSAVLGVLTRVAGDLTRRCELPNPRIPGVGVAVSDALAASGPTDLRGRTGAELAGGLSRRLGLAVSVDGEARAAALGERWSGGPHRLGSFLYAHLGATVSIGVVLADQVHRGISNNAGAIGHVGNGHAGRECVCGKRGCLDTWCSMSAVVRDWRSAGGDGAGLPVSVAYERLCVLAADGDPAATRVLRAAATKLGQALATVVSILDVDRVVLGGPAVVHVDGLITERVSAALQAQVWAPAVRPVRVESALVRSSAGAVGAAAMVLDHTHAPRLATLFGD